jgi:hypothetical protein
MTLIKKLFHTDNPNRDIFRQSTTGLCQHCRRITRFYDIDFKAWFCSEECQDAKIAEFNQAVTAAAYEIDYDPDYFGAWYE